MRTQVTVPTADMLMRYCMLPYHVVSKFSSPGEDGGRERV